MAISAINGGANEPIGVAREKKLLEDAAKADAAKIKVLDDRIAALNELDTRRKDLYTSLTQLADPTTLNARAVSLNNPDSLVLSATSEPGGLMGSHSFNILSIASPSSIQSASGQGQALYTESVSTSSSATGPLLSALNLPGLTAGSLTLALGADASGNRLNVSPLSVDFSQTLQEFFQQIESASSGDVLASYDSSTDRFTLISQSGRDIILGAPNDESNFWSVSHLFSVKYDSTMGPQPSTQSTTSEAPLGSVNIQTNIINACLSQGASIATGDQSLLINGISIAYNIETDSIANLMQAIANSAANVQLNYQRATDSFSLINTQTGALSINLSDTGGLLNALGLTTSTATLLIGDDASLQVDNGPIIHAHSNTVDSTTHGIKGLNITLKTVGKEGVQVSADTSLASGAVQKFVDAYNKYAEYARDKTRNMSLNGKTEKGLLAYNKDLISFNNELRNDLLDTLVTNNKVVKTPGMLGILGSQNSQDPKISFDTSIFSTQLVENPLESLSVLDTLSNNLQEPIAPYINPSLRNLPAGTYKTPQDIIRAEKSKIQAQQLKRQKEIEKKDKQIELDIMRVQAAQERGQRISAMFQQSFGRS